MTEARWYECRDPVAALHFLEGRTSERKRRLFAVACCRRIEHLITQFKGAFRAVVLGERIANGEQPTEEACGLVSQLQGSAFWLIDGYRQEKENNVLWNAACAAASCVSGVGPRPIWSWPTNLNNAALHAASAVAHAARRNDRDPVNRAAQAVEAAAQMQFIDCIFGNPFYDCAFNPAWRTDTAVAVARQMYDARDFAAMPVLADALQDAGCDSAGVLAHCRGDGPHVRGCWVVDLVTARG